MADGYWNRQPPLHTSAGMLKRHHSDYDLPPSGVPSAHEMHNYLARDDDHGGPRVVKDTQTIETAYDRYLKNAQLPSYTSGEDNNFGGVALGRAVGGRRAALPDADPVVMGRSSVAVPDLAPNGRGMDFGGQLPRDAMAKLGRITVPLPPDASNTIYVEGLPPNSTKREVAHIFRPFVGYKEVRIVSKESKHRGGDPLILCFVDFINPACAATALSALQGYKMDEHDPGSSYLRLQFSKHPGPRSGSGPRGKR
ncbi:RNA-binding protein 2-like [Cornus florida]|uniref:RNA-binding protein 2-like n=1 Tax=Cornus florida TaxID=4283 RepID=UPI00289ACD64|nr:RNA-binding protein 2-like [Cornus florida]